MKPGDLIHIRACKADGTVYRSWFATIESVTADSIVTIAPPKQPVFDLARKQYDTVHPLRSYYWFDKQYNLIEVFEVTGELLEIYLNIASLPSIGDKVLSYIDHELDVSKPGTKPAQLVDEDEFAEAVVKYRYSQEFQQKMYAAAREALELAENWKAAPAPVF